MADSSRWQGEHGCVTTAGIKGIRAPGWATGGTWVGVKWVTRKKENKRKGRENWAGSGLAPRRF
jgi:hypothetical protein